MSTVFLFCCSMTLFWVGSIQAQDLDSDLLSDDFATNDIHVSDPLEPINRVFFSFNDKLYFWVLKPVSKTYAAIVAVDIRTCIGNAFKNLLAPVRIVNNLLQGKVSDSGVELARFIINTLAGAGGLGDPARDSFHLNPKNEDLGQTLGKWGAGEGIYICWPIFGPSNIRDTVGFVGDAFLNPLTYLSLSDESSGWVAQGGQKVNSTSMSLGDYEQFKESTFDPYTAMRDFYYQSRRSKINDRILRDKNFAGVAGNTISAVQTNEPSDIGESAGNDDLLPRESTVRSYADLNNIEEYGELQWSKKLF